MSPGFKLDEAILQRYTEADRKRKAAQAELTTAENLVKTIKKDIIEWMTTKMKNSLTKGKFIVTLKDGPKYPKWKDAYIEAFGEEEAKKVEAKTEPSKVLDVQIK